MTEKNNKKSLIMNIIAMAIYGSIGVFRKYTPVSSGLLAFVRGTVGTIFIIIFVKLRGKKLRTGMARATAVLLAVSGALIGINWVMLFESFNYTTVATATLCYYMAPTFIILLSPVFLKERLTVKKGICALLAIIGMVFVSGVAGQGLPQGNELTGILLGIGAAVIYAIVVMINKKLPGVDAFAKTMIQLAFSAIVLIPYLFATGGWQMSQVNLKVIILLLVMGLVHTGIAYTLYFASMDGLRANTVALFSYIDPVVSLILAAVLLHEAFTVYSLIGAVLILGAAVISEVHLGKRKNCAVDNN